MYSKNRKLAPLADYAWVLVNHQHVFCGSMAQCRAYVTLLSFGPSDLVQIQTIQGG